VLFGTNLPTYVRNVEPSQSHPV